MALGGVSQNNSLQTRWNINNLSNTNRKPKPFNGGTVSVEANAKTSQKDVLRAALLKFAFNAGIKDQAAREAFADRWISKMGGASAKLYSADKPVTDTAFKNDKSDGTVSVSIIPGEHDAIIRDLRNVQVEQKVITFSEANFTPISKEPAKTETPMDSILRSSYEESLIFDPSQMTRQNLEQKYRDSQYAKLAQDPELSEIALDLTQMGLDIIGIFEPTPFADGTNTVISALRGDWGNAALSALGIVPYVGDLAKFGKIPKWIASIEKISKVIDKLGDVARLGGKAADAAKGFVREVKRLLDKIPFDQLPDTLRDAFKSLKQKVDEFFSKMTKADNPADNIKNADNVTDTAKTADTTKTAKTTTETTPKQPDVEPPKKPDLEQQKKVEKAKKQKEIEDAKLKRQKEITDKYDEISQNGHTVQRHGEGITERQLDDRAMYGKDPVTGTTDDAYKTYPDGTPKLHNYGKDATKFTSKESLVKAENYVRNSQKYKDAITDAVNNGSDKIVIKDIKLEDIYGTDYRKYVFGKTRTGTKNNPTGTIETDFTDGKIRAVFEKDTNGNWNLETMFPEPKN